MGNDSIFILDPETLQERVAVVSICEPAYALVQSCIVRQVWYYHIKTKQFANRTIGISLMIPAEKRSENSNSLDKKEEILYYVEFPNFTDAASHINSPNVPFCMETTEALDFSTFKVLKGNSQKTFEQVFFQLPKEQKIDVYSVESGYCCNEIVDKEERHRTFQHTVDTVTTFHPITYAASVRLIEKPELTFEQYNDTYRIKQTWYFDSKSNQLVSKLNSIAPTKAEYDENGNFLYDQSLFYLCFSKSTHTKDKRR